MRLRTIQSALKEAITMPHAALASRPSPVAPPKPSTHLIGKQRLPAVWMRAGTSKGLFLRREDLPTDQALWAQPLLASMGNDPRQINGIGGATSTTSKVAIVGASKRKGIDVDYTFAQVGFGQGTVDFSGNCGNMASGVGPFAIQEGLVRCPKTGKPKMSVSIFNTNTQTTMVETVEVDEHGDFREDGNFTMPGLKGITGSEIKVAFMHPEGSMTGKIFPSGNYWDLFAVETSDLEKPMVQLRASLIDVANPFVLVDATSLPVAFQDSRREDTAYLEFVESIRRQGAVRMGLADTVQEASRTRSTPKIAFLWPSIDDRSEIKVRAFSMGKPHPSLQLTGAVCVGSAVCLLSEAAQLPTIPTTAITLPTERETKVAKYETEVGDLVSPSDSLRQVRIEHASGTMNVDVVLRRLSDAVGIERATVSRTARRLFDGYVYYHS